MQAAPPGETGGDVPGSAEAAHDRLLRENLYTYYAMIENIDDNMARLLAQLEATGLAQDTVVIFLSDHGELGGAHGLVGKNQPYEESIGIPLIIYSANPALVPGGRRVDAPVATEDLFPTLCGLAGLPPDPAKPGLDLSPLLRGEAGGIHRDAILIEHVAELRPGRDFHDEAWRGIRTATHKYTVRGNAAGGHPWQMFDLVADPGEITNLLEDADSRPLAATLHAGLYHLLQASDDHFPLAAAFDSDSLNLPRA